MLPEFGQMAWYNSIIILIYLYVTLSIKFYILNITFNLIRMRFSLFTPSLFYLRFVKMLYSLKILPGNSR